MKSPYLALAATLSIASTAVAEERRVPEEFPTIAAAFAVAAAGDVISVAPGSYDIGLLAMPGVPVTLRGRGTAAETILVGDELRIFGGTGVRTVENLTMRGFTGYAAIHVDGASAAIRSVAFEQNNTGLFLNTSATVQSIDCVFRNNIRGGGGYVNCTWNATDCVFEDNSGCPCYGGAVGFHIDSGGTFLRCRFIGNSASTGGAIGLSFGGDRVFDQCYFEGNTSPSGAVWWTEFGASGVLSNSTLCGHSSLDIVGGWVDGGGNQFFPKGCAAPCPADLVDDGVVNSADIAVVLNFWGTNGTQYAGVDLNSDGIVNGADLAAVLGAWGACPE